MPFFTSLTEQVTEFITSHFWAIAGVICAACLSAYLTSRNGRSARRAAANASFRVKVLTELGSIYPVPASWPEDINSHLRAAFPALQVAVAEFRPYVPWWRRWRFDKAWFCYHCSTGRKVDAQVYHHYMAFSSQPDPKAMFHKNVSRLLSFANEN